MREEIEVAAGAAPRTRLIRNRDFVLLWSGQLVSAVGFQLSLLAFPLLILGLTKSPAEAGALVALRSLPFVFLSLPAGVFVDRWDRKLTMILCDSGRAIALGSIPVALAFGHLTFAQIAAVALVEGTLFTFFNISEIAALPRVVRPDQLGYAIGLYNGIDSVSTLVGPAAGGALYALSRGLPFLLDAVSYAASVVSLLFIRVPFQKERVSTPLSFRREIGEGVVWLWRNRTVRFLAILVGGLMLFSFGYPIIMIVRAQELHASPSVIGLLFASGGIGSLAASASVGWLQRKFRVGHLLIASSIVWVVTWLPYALAPNLIAFAVANVFGWIVVPILIGVQLSYRLKVIPDELQGRVNSVFKLVAFGSQPIGLALAGISVQLIGPVNTVYVFLIPQAMLAVTAALHRDLRSLPNLSAVSI